jgi:hypothetical protein
MNCQLLKFKITGPEQAKKKSSKLKVIHNTQSGVSGLTSDTQGCVHTEQVASWLVMLLAGG